MTMFKWTCEQLARQLIKQHFERIQRRLKWLVALRLYENEPAIKKMIEGKLVDFPR